MTRFRRHMVSQRLRKCGKIVLYSCGDNTRLFDTFIAWGFDGCHAYEPTSTVNIFREKTLHGDKLTMIGNVGIDYLLTDRSKEMATTIFLVLGVGSTLVGIFFAYLGDWLYKKSPRYMPMLCGITVLAGIVPMRCAF